MDEDKPRSSLWTYDFTVITLGSVVSMVGNALSGFAMSIMVLDYTGSTFLYALFSVCYQLPMVICPLLAGPYLDRVSRKKVIYRLDFLSAGLYLGLFLLLKGGWFSYPLLLAGCVLLGSLDGVYVVAYDSFYPNLIPAGNYAKAYSVSSMLWPIAAMSQPLAAVVYDRMGSVTELFLFNALCFLTAACFERTIRHQETHMDRRPADEPGAAGRFARDFKEGIVYLREEKGLLAITAYFTVSGFAGSAAGSLHLPFFRNHPQLFALWPVGVVTLYSLVSNFSVAGRVVGGAIHYRIRIPPKKKFAIAMAVYVIIEVLEAGVLFLPIPAMALAFFLSGALAVTSYNIRIASVQAYIPDGRRARFNGIFQMACSAGSVMGALTAGALAEVMPERQVILLCALLSTLALYFFLYRRRTYVAEIYDREV